MFERCNEAVEYAIRCQRDRRNVSDADMARWILEVDKRKKQGERTDLTQGCVKSGPTSKQTAAIVGSSARKVEQVRTIADHAPEKIEEIKSGAKSINRAYVEKPAL